MEENDRDDEYVGSVGISRLLHVIIIIVLNYFWLKYIDDIISDEIYLMLSVFLYLLCHLIFLHKYQTFMVTCLSSGTFQILTICLFYHNCIPLMVILLIISFCYYICSY